MLCHKIEVVIYRQNEIGPHLPSQNGGNIVIPHGNLNKDYCIFGGGINIDVSIHSKCIAQCVPVLFGTEVV